MSQLSRGVALQAAQETGTLCVLPHMVSTCCHRRQAKPTTGLNQAQSDAPQYNDTYFSVFPADLACVPPPCDTQPMCCAGHFDILSKDVGVPLVAFRLKAMVGSDGKPHRRLYDEFALADRVRMRGWVLPGGC